MLKKIIIRWFFIVLTLIGGIYYILPTYKYYIYSLDADYHELKDIYKDQAIKLGLDLSGGLYIVLELDYASYLLKLSNPKLNFESKMNLKKLINQTINNANNHQSSILNEFKELSNKQNIDLNQYYSNLTQSKQKKENHNIINLINENKKQSMSSILDVMRNRIENHNQYGVGEPSVQKLGDDRIVIELAGITDINKAKGYIQRTAEFELSLVLNKEIFLNVINKIDNAKLTNEKIIDFLIPGIRSDFLILEDNFKNIDSLIGKALDNNLIPNQYKILWGNQSINYENKKLKNIYLVHTKGIISNGEIDEPRALISEFGNEDAGKWIVNLDMSREGKAKWSRFTGNNIGEQVAIILDNKVYMAPTIQAKISSGGTRITGFSSKQEAEEIAGILKAGELAAPINILQINYIGPSLGQDSIDAGAISLFFGLIIVLVFMLIYYNLSGIIANIALFLNIIFILAILVTMDAVLTLPGLAGLLLTVGMSVDANVIIFERIREEIKLKKSALSAITIGYDKAFLTIFDSNVTTLLTAFVLSFIGSGPIRGFATTLSIGIICSMYTAIFITKTFFLTSVYFMKIKKLSI